MKLENFLNEKILLDVDEMVNILKKDCPKFLIELKRIKSLLYRGSYKVSDKSKQYVLKNSLIYHRVKVRVDRTPSDMPIELHNYLNGEFKKKFGWSTRSEGVFCTKSNSLSWNYGNAYSIFPIGDYKYIYSNKIEDLFTHFEEMGGDSLFMWILAPNALRELKFLNFETFDTKHMYRQKYGENLNGEWLYNKKPTGEKDYVKILDKISKESKIDRATVMKNLRWKPDISFDMYLEELLLKEKEELYKYVREILKTYKTNNLEQAKEKTEVMLKCNEYYMIPVRRDLTDLLIDRLF